MARLSKGKVHFTASYERRPVSHALRLVLTSRIIDALVHVCALCFVLEKESNAVSPVRNPRSAPNEEFPESAQRSCNDHSQSPMFCADDSSMCRSHEGNTKHARNCKPVIGTVCGATGDHPMGAPLPATIRNAGELLLAHHHYRPTVSTTASRWFLRGEWNDTKPPPHATGRSFLL